MINKIDIIELGGTLFIPATHKNLLEVISGVKYKNLKSVVVDTEDSILDDELFDALACVKNMLNTFERGKLFVFIRPRDEKVLKEILGYKNIEKIDGFVLPKFSLDNADEYLIILEDSKYFIMPSIEGKELFNQSELLKLKDKLLRYKDKIIAIRFGLEDMLRQLKMKRNCEQSIFDFSVTCSVIGGFLAIFKSCGFDISGGVYPCFRDMDGFKKDVQRDMTEGLFSKTIIHPNQIDTINELYKVTQDEFDEALKVCNSEKAIFNQDGKMAETTTMRPYFKDILKRANTYGLKK